MIKTLILTEDHLKLIRFLNVENTDDAFITIDKRVMLRLQSHILDDVAMILGMRDKAIEGTEEDAEGAAYPDDVEEYLLSVYNYVSDNMYLIETLLHQRVMEGIQPGVYTARDTDLIWEYKGETNG